MATSLALTHSSLVGLWMQSSALENKSDSVLRYAIYKYMHKNGNLNVIAGLDITKWFENYTIEEMRFVMNNNIDDEEILWLNAYTQQFIDNQGSVGNRLTPHPYIAYVWPNYGNPIYYDEENKMYFNELFSVPSPNNNGKRVGLWDLTYKIPGGKDVSEYTIKVSRGTSNYKLYKVWMNMRNKFGTGAVCGGISKTGANIRGVHGIPAAVIGQPGHAAIIYYTQDANGNGYWNLDNDVSGWAYSEKGERMLLGWGNASYSRGYSVSYMALAQEVLNHNDLFEQSEKFVYLADSYSELTKKEEMYRKALNIQPLNIDAWYELIQVYNKSSNKTEEDYFELAKEIAENLKYYPLPMYHLTNLIKPKLVSVQSSYQFTLLQTRILKEASVTPNNTADQYYVYQPSLTRGMANFLLGQMDTTIATFSFDGEDKDTIVLSDRFDGNGVRWDYSLDGKKTWKEVSFTAEEVHKHKLTKEEVASITSVNDIYIHIVGVNYEEENLYKIDIKESIGLPTTLFASDLENQLIGATDSVEWKYNENDHFIRYGSEKPELTGDKTVILRMGATETYLASTTNVTVHFTKDVVDKKRKYIPVSHLSLEGVSTEAVNQQGSAVFALDANYNTRWHSAWNGSDTERFITVKLDRPVYLSSVEFVPAGGGNGKIYDGTVWGSMDGENWILLSQKKGLTYTNAATTLSQAIDNIKDFDIENPQKVQYVKIVADRTNGNWFTARAFNFYEDTTVKQVATFSFDGTNAGKIVLYDEYKNKHWKYSLDGGKTWKMVMGDSCQLSTLELENINAKDMILVVLDGDKTEYTIKVKKGIVPEYGYLNDLENRVIAQPEKEKLEWKISGDEHWTSYSEEEPYVEHNKTLFVRRRATGLITASDAIEYVFTEDNESKNMSYISNKHLSVHDFISQSKDTKRPHYASNILDGNPNTQWHTDFAVSIAGKEAFITIKLDEARYISGLDYLHMDESLEPYGFMKNGRIYVSEDGDIWKEAATVTNVKKDSTLKHIAFNDSIYGQYVKLVIESYDNVFAAASMINLYEDRTKITAVKPTAEIEYSTTKPTNKDVVVKLVNPSKEIKITNNGGKDTYTFTKNGSFTFTFVDKDGNEGSVDAKVSWIDKKIPNATITYSTTKLTNKDVVATVTFDKEGVVVEGGSSYTFTENGRYEFHFIGPAGNKGVAVAEVDWIDKRSPIATIEYDYTSPTNKDVTAMIKFDEKDVKITNNGGKNTYTFKENTAFTFTFEDKAGNQGSITAEVNWIDRRLATPTVTYSTTQLTNKDVVATVTFDKEGVVVEGGSSYTFTENGRYEFHFIGPAGNKGVAVAEVDWIDKRSPIATISYNSTNRTNKDVVATVTFDEENVKITNNNGKNTHTFYENGIFTFKFIDKAGNKGEATAVVNIIDKVVPTAKIIYSTTELTNKDVVATLTDFSEDITIINNDGRNTYTFTKNGSFTFEFMDKAGNKGVAVAEVNNIDKTIPSAKVKYSTNKLTNKDVIATLTDFSEDITIINNDGRNTYTFTKNGSFAFEFIDKAGNMGTAVAEVDWIDKRSPIATIEYDYTMPTNKDVTAMIKFDEKDVKITNNGGKNTYTFKENGSFTFEFIDKAGNQGSITAEVNWIDRRLATPTITYSTTQLTNKDVVATVTFDKEGVVVEGGGSYTFTENGRYEFHFIGPAGNKGVAVAEVDWIDKRIPVATIEYDYTRPTNKDVIATIKFDEENVQITNNGGKNGYTFTKNGSFTFEFIDKAGNEGEATAVVNNIDKVVPTAKVIYSTIDPTNQDVIVTLTDFSEHVKIINNDGKSTKVFTKNGVFTFEFVDEAGNKGTITAIVNNIKKVAPTAKVIYSTTELTNKDVVATLTDLSDDIKIINNDGKDTYTFHENGTFVFEFIDKAGNVGTAVAIVNNIDRVVPTAKVLYSSSSPTSGNIVATLEECSEEIIVLNNNGNRSYTFTENGTFEFKISDKAGNIAIIEAKVTWISPSMSNSSLSSTIAQSNQSTSSSFVTPPINNNQATYEVYKIAGVVLHVPIHYWPENTELKIKYLDLDSNTQEKIGGDNEYFELYVEPIVSASSNEKISMYIDIKSDKKFLGIYKISDDQRIDKLEYKEFDDKRIEVQVDGLGKYVLSYESEEKDNILKDAPIINKGKKVEKDISINMIILIMIVFLLSGISTVLVLKGRKH